MSHTTINVAEKEYIECPLKKRALRALNKSTYSVQFIKPLVMDDTIAAIAIHKRK